jgi:hypothetical protein
MAASPKGPTATLLDRPEEQDALLFLKGDDPAGHVEMCSITPNEAGRSGSTDAYIGTHQSRGS